MQPLLNNKDIIRLQRRKYRSLKSASRFINLDAPNVSSVGCLYHSGNSGRSKESHIHDIRIYKTNHSYYFSKPEDVYRKIGFEDQANFTSFLSFARSVFELGEGFTPVRHFRFPDDPEIPEIRYYRSEILENETLLARFRDDFNPADIENSAIRSLFILYTGRKENLLHIGNEDYENAFSHHGRDILFEVLASHLGKLLGIRVTRCIFGIKNLSFSRSDPHSGVDHKYVIRTRHCLSRALSLHPLDLTLDKVLTKLQRNTHEENAFTFYREWSNANPLGIGYFEDTIQSPSREKLGDLVRKVFPYHEDLICSDVLDHLLGAEQDRKLQEYIMPQGDSGPIYTVDYGEILFPELEFGTDESHYIRRKIERMEGLRIFIDRVLSLPQSSPYRRIAGKIFGLLITLGPAYFDEFVRVIPSFAFQGGWDKTRLCCSPLTLSNYFHALRITILQSLFAEKSALTAGHIDRKIQADPYHVLPLINDLFA